MDVGHAMLGLISAALKDGARPASNQDNLLRNLSEQPGNLELRSKLLRSRPSISADETMEK